MFDTVFIGYYKKRIYNVYRLLPEVKLVAAVISTIGV